LETAQVASTAATLETAQVALTAATTPQFRIAPTVASTPQTGFDRKTMASTRSGKEGQKTTLINWITPQKGSNMTLGKDVTTSVKSGSKKGGRQDMTLESSPVQETTDVARTPSRAGTKNINPTKKRK
jgi:hypothetical protein